MILQKLGVQGFLALVTHAAILYLARDSPRSMLAAIFFYLIFRILAVKGVLTLYRLRPTAETKKKLYRFAREPDAPDREMRLSSGGCFQNLLVYGTIAYMMTWISYLPMAPDYPDFADFREGLVIFLAYDLKTFFCKDLAIDFDADEPTNYDFNMAPAAALIGLAFLWMPGVAVTKWLEIDWAWGLLGPLVLCLAIMDFYTRTGWEP